MAARPGGEQLEVKVRSATQTSPTLVEVNSIRPVGPGSLPLNGEPQTLSKVQGKPVALKGNVQGKDQICRKAMTGANRWLEAERTEVLERESERPARISDGVHC